MADALISPLLEQITTIAVQQVQQQVKLVVGVEKDIEKLTSNLVAVQAVLEDAERRQLKDAAAKNWLNNLKAVSFDMDDVLDEWSTAILQWQMKEAENAPVPKKMVCSFLPSPCFCFNQVVTRHDIALKIKEISERLDEIAKERARYGFELNKATEELERPKTTSFIDESDVCGRDDAKKNLVSKLLCESNLEAGEVRVVSIVGMGGIGKTTLAQLVYDDAEIKAHFKERIWVCVSDPFDEARIAKAIIEHLRGETPNLVELEPLCRKISGSIVGKRFLLVLDDVWTEDYRQWEPLKLALKSGAPGSRILVTTRNDRVAKMMRTTDLLPLQELSADECWSLFSQVAFYGRSRDEHEKLVGIGKKIADKCKGLPLAAKVLGGLMQTKTTREEWENVLSSELWEIEQVERGLFPPLLLSYYGLPTAIRRCFTYCAMFRKDSEIEKGELIKMWMAQGYLKATPSRDMELVGKEYFDILASRALFQDFHEVRPCILEFKMHDIVHDFAQFLTNNECFSMDVSDIREARINPSYKEVRHSSMMLSRDAAFPVSIHKAGKLRSLVISSKNPSIGSALQDLFRHLTCLRSLNLSETSIEEIPSGIGQLIHLRHLNLADCRWLNALPETMSNLSNLQSLDLFRCRSLSKLPQEMGKLAKLRHLELQFSGVACMPKGIGRLVSLRTLTNFVLCGGDGNESEAANLGELKNLNHIGGTLEIINLANIADVSQAVKAELKKKKHLLGLILHFTRDETESQVSEDAVIEALQPQPDLEVLRIIDYKGICLPSWIMSLTELRELRFSDCGNIDVLPPLGRLAYLEALTISGLNTNRLDVGFLGLESISAGQVSPAFPKLKKLSIQDMEELEEWDGVGKGEEKDTIIIMTQLRELEIWNCPKLREIANYILAAPLKELDIWNCPILMERYERFGEDWDKISHIPQISVI